MKNLKNFGLLLFAFLFAMSSFSSCDDSDDVVIPAVVNNGNGNGNGNGPGNGDGNAIGDCSTLNPSATVSDAEIDLLKYMREEEKLARDVYVKMFALYDAPVFNNISKSEQTHMDRVLCLLEYYGIEDPASTESGVFTNPDLQALYDALIAQGSVSLTDAYTVGATIEDVDIYDLEEYIAQTDNPAIISVYENLTCGSRNHMRAFISQLNNLGETYTPQFIPQTEYDEIINGGHEQCGQ